MKYSFVSVFYPRRWADVAMSNLLIAQYSTNITKRKFMVNKKNTILTKHQEDVLIPITMDEVREKIIVLRGEPVILDMDVAALYGVQTKEVNQAVKNNPGKFPVGYLFMLNNQ